jgi:RNA polymerase sigma-70 factor (ECF subfamily)
MGDHRPSARLLRARIGKKQGNTPQRAINSIINSVAPWDAETMASDFEVQERSLVEKCLKGDGQAWEDFLRIHYRIIVTIVHWRKWGFEREEREDIVQDIVTGIVNSLETFQFKSKLTTFVYSISVNTCVTHLRKKKALKRQAHFQGSSEDAIACEHSAGAEVLSRFGSKNPEELFMNREIASIILRSVTRLTDRCKELIRYRYFEDLTFQDISRKTGTKKNTLVIQLKRCLQRLHKHLYSEISHEQ